MYTGSGMSRLATAREYAQPLLADTGIVLTAAKRQERSLAWG